MTAERHEFQAEVTQLLDLMIHSLYSHKDVFLRELISNASDAIDRLRFASLTHADWLPSGEFAIHLRVDPQARTLEVADNGIGMSRDEVLQNLGTIARSGTGEFLRQMKEAGEAAAPELIGQFGVGFYASFMAADEVTVTTRRAGETTATRWHSKGDGAYDVEDAERDSVGTSIVLQLKEVDGEAGLADFSDEFVLRQIVKRYSDFVAHPIHLEIRGEDGEPKELAGPNEPLNSRKAIWTRPQSEVTDEEHADFYKHIGHDWNDPLLHVWTRIEGNFEASALLYVPKVAPFDLYHREMAHKGIQLYVKRVFIMDECRELMPEWLRFVKGVVDAEDLSLNVSREMLQQDRQIQAIRRHLVKKVLDRLTEFQKDDADAYRSFWEQFGPVLKEGLLPFDEKPETKSRVLGLLLANSTKDESALTSLADYVERMPEGQEEIYVMCGASLSAMRGSPHLEAFEAKGIEVLLLTDPVDELWVEQARPEFEGKHFRSVGKGEVDLESLGQTQDADGEGEDKKDEEPSAEEAQFEGLVQALRAAVQDQVKEVRLSKRLTSSPACLVLEEGDLSPQMADMLRNAGQEVPEIRPVLELNPSHSLLGRLREVHAENPEDPRIADYAELLFGQALLAEGGQLADPTRFSRKLAELMAGAL